MTFSAVIVAAGSGTRAGPGQAKQWRPWRENRAALVGGSLAGRRRAKARDRTDPEARPALDEVLKGLPAGRRRLAARLAPSRSRPVWPPSPTVPPTSRY
jgi:hypothetical protein